MRQFKQVCNRYLTMGRQEFNRGDVVRIVSLSDRDAMILNEDSKIHGFDYVKIEKPIEVKIENLIQGEEKDRLLKLKEFQSTIENAKNEMASKFSEAAKKRTVTKKIKKEIAKDKLTGE